MFRLLRFTLILSLLTCLLHRAAHPQTQQSLVIQFSDTGSDTLGFAIGEHYDQLHWFALKGDQPTILSNVAPDTYEVGLLCANVPKVWSTAVVREGLTSHIVLQRFERKKPDSKPEGMDVYSHAYSLDLGPAARVFLNPCPLQDLLLPPLLNKPNRTASAAEVTETVAAISGAAGSNGILKPKTPVELLMSLLVYLEQRREYAIRKREEAEHLIQVRQLVAEETAQWSRTRGPLLANQVLSDKGENVFLGTLVAAGDIQQLTPGETATFTIQYLSSHEMPASGNVSYELEVVQEPPITAKEIHIQIQPQHEYPSQEIVPSVVPGLWKFQARALPGFKGTDIEFRYRLWKKQPGKETREISSGQLVKSARLELKPQPPPLGEQSRWESLVSSVKAFGGATGWILATILGLIQIKHARDARPKPPLTELEP